MSFQNKTQFGSSKSSGKEVVHVNLVRTVRTEQLPIRRAKGSETDRGGETEFGKMNIGHGSQVLGAIKSRVGEVRSILGRMAYKTRCTEQGLERIGEQMGVIEQSVSESLSKAVRDEIVDEVVQVVRAGEKRRNGGRRQGNPEAHKVQERVKRLVDSVATTTQQKRNGLKRKQPDTKHKQGGFEISGAISGKNANILKFLFQKSYVGEERWSFEIGRCGEFAVTRMDIQCLSPSTTLSSKLQMLDLVFADEIELDFLPGFRYSTFPWASTILFPYDNFPVQPNAFDCGIFVIRNMQYFGKNWYVEDEYVSNDHRASLAMECINHPHNEVVNELLEMVEAFARST